MQEIQKKRSRGSRLPGSVLRTAAVIVFLALVTSVAASEPAEEPLTQSHTHTEHERNEIGVFLGVTTGGEKEGGGKEDATASIGIGYRRNVSR